MVECVKIFVGDTEVTMFYSVYLFIKQRWKNKVHTLTTLEDKFL